MQRRCPMFVILIALFALTAAAAWAGGAKVQVCHIPPGNPSNFHTITISENALQAHLGHGDLPGTCFEHCDTLCSDNDPCTIDACDANEHCLLTHPPVNCDDSNPCTTDSCDPASGCVNAPKSCVDGSLCTLDSCDPITGDCVFPAIACPTGQSCNPANGMCACVPGYTGPQCDVDIDECVSQPCQHGDCIDGVNSYSCACQPGYTGTNCEIEIDECESNPCQHGTCNDMVNGYSCTCEAGWTGTNCEQPQQQTYNCSDRNPCTPENIAAGLFYFSADDPAGFIQCDQFGGCYEMTCPPGTVWNQSLLTCIEG